MTQLDLITGREPEPDRNFDKGGRSFYFFDLDDNVFHLTTPIYLFHKDTKEELVISSADLARHYSAIGQNGVFKDFNIDLCDRTGTFRRFRDVDAGNAQPFVEDLQNILKQTEDWRGPSWNCFYHAAFNQRPVSLITARGHHPDTIKDGISVLVKNGHLPMNPNYLSVYPVSHPETRKTLALDQELSVSELKLKAVIESVEQAMTQYGFNPHHRFGMSDDDPKNLELIFKAMLILKNKYPDNSFFVIHTKDTDYIKEEVFLDHTESKKLHPKQFSFF